MSSILKGKIINFYEKDRILLIEINEEKSFFFLSRSLAPQIFKYKTLNNVNITFEYSEATKEYKNQLATRIISITEISNDEGILYSVDSIKNQTVELINSFDYKMFVDFEFTMPAFNEKSKFEYELLQVGIVISDPNDKVVDEYSSYIKTKKKVSDRTKRFLNISNEELAESVSQKEFYNLLQNYFRIYTPTVFVWGSSDIKALNKFYDKNHFKQIKFDSVDLAKIIRSYYSLQEDLGLFAALQIFNGIQATQAHHALTDASATKEVFDSFKKILNNDTKLNVKEIRSHMKDELKDNKTE